MKSTSPQIDDSAADVIATRRPEIVESIAVVARDRLPHAAALSRDDLVGHLPALLDEIAACLADGAVTRRVETLRAIARDHARRRTRSPQFRIDEHLAEYRVALRVITNVLRASGRATDLVEDVVIDAVQIASAAAAIETSAHERDPLLDELESHALLDEVLRQLPVGVSITDGRTGKALLHNDEVVRLVERDVHSRRSLEDFRSFGAIHPDGRPYAVDDYPTTRAIRRGEVVTNEDMLYRTVNGTLRTLLVNSRPIRDRHGNILLAVTSVHDVSAVRELTARLRLVADSVPIHLLLLDRGGRFLFANAAAAETWQMRPEDFVGRTVRDVIGERAYAAIAGYGERALAGETVSYEAPFVVPDGTVRTFLSTYTPHRDVDGTIRGFVATGTDITERKTAEDRLRASLDELHEERELRDRFIAALTHDLRTPLSAARIGADVLLHGAADGERSKRAATRIAANIDRADAMIRDLLDANLLRAGGTLPLETTPGDLVAITRSTLEELTTIHGNRFALDAPAAIEGTWDAGAVRRILENLCGNAVKYGAPSRPIGITLATHGANATIDIHNEGTPIPHDDQARLFEAFHRTESARGTGQRGWGVGLALVRGLAEAHGGSASLSSSGDAGTIFRVVLPLRASA